MTTRLLHIRNTKEPAFFRIIKYFGMISRPLLSTNCKIGGHGLMGKRFWPSKLIDRIGTEEAVYDILHVFFSHAPLTEAESCLQ